MSISILANFKRRSLIYQTAIVAIIFFSVYSLYMDYIGAPNIGESIFAAVIFSASYFMTSTLVLRKKMQARRKK